MAGVAKIQPMSVPEKPRKRDRYRARSGSHEPQITYSRNIIRPRRVSSFCAMPRILKDLPALRTMFRGSARGSDPSLQSDIILTSGGGT